LNKSYSWKQGYESYQMSINRISIRNLDCSDLAIIYVLASEIIR